MHRDGTMAVYEKGKKKTSHTRYSAGDVARLVVIGDAITYECNGRVLYASTAQPTFPLQIDTTFLDLEAKATDVKLVRVQYWRHRLAEIGQ
jgi:hypothetical protein